MGRPKKIHSNYDTTFVVRCNSYTLATFDSYCSCLGVSRNHLINSMLTSFVSHLSEDFKNEHAKADFDY